MYSILCVKVAVIDPEAPSASAVMEEARKFMIATFYKEAVVPLALDLTADNDEMRQVYLNLSILNGQLHRQFSSLFTSKRDCTSL